MVKHPGVQDGPKWHFWLFSLSGSISHFSKLTQSEKRRAAAVCVYVREESAETQAEPDSIWLSVTGQSAATHLL